MRSPHLLLDIRLLYAYRSSCPCESELIKPYLISIIFLGVESASAGHIPRVKFHASSERKTRYRREPSSFHAVIVRHPGFGLVIPNGCEGSRFLPTVEMTKKSLLTNRRSRLKPPRTRQFAPSPWRERFDKRGRPRGCPER